jgi:hypothetical protein
MADFDLFILFRSALVIFATIYSVLLTVSGMWRLVRVFAGADPKKQMLRLYLSYQLLTIRLAPVRSELIQIALWLTLLVGIWRLHSWV